jgi:hypothetical protein
VLRGALDRAKLGDPDKLNAFRRLDTFVHAVEERYSPRADFDAVLAHEHAISSRLGGRSVFDNRRPARSVKASPKQLSLF